MIWRCSDHLISLSHLRCWWETWPAVHLGRLVLLVAQVVWFLDRVNELIIVVVICISMVAETWKQQLMWGNTVMSLHERDFCMITELYCSSFYCISKQTPCLQCRYQTGPSTWFSWLFQWLPSSPLLSIYCDCERLEYLMAQISRYTIAGCVFKLLYLSGRFLWVCNPDVGWKSNDFAVFDKSMCIIHT